MEVQAWILRRCLSHLNRICARPYRPKDKEIRWLCSELGVEWPEVQSREVLEEEEEDDEDQEEEECESEGGTTDAEVEVAGAGKV